MREDKTLITDYLLDQCFEHFNLDALGAAQDDFRPHIVAIHEEVTHSLAKQVKFAFGPEPAVIRSTAAPAPLLPQKQRQQRQDLDNSTQDTIIKEFIAAYSPNPSGGDRKGGASPSLRSSSGRADPFAAPHPAHTQLLGASLALEEDEDDEDGHEDLFFEEPHCNLVSLSPSPLLSLRFILFSYLCSPFSLSLFLPYLENEDKDS